MTSILIAGSTGLVGRHVLARALEDVRINRVVAPTRRALSPHPKLVNPVLDMSALPARAQWWGVDSVVCTLGTTRANAGSDAAFRAIDFDLQLAIARHTFAHGARRFALTSSMGADPDSRFLYLRTKGELENAVSQLDWYSLTIIRPGAILGEREEARAGEAITATALRILAPVLPKKYRGNQAQDIAALLFASAVDGTPGQHILKSGDILDNDIVGG